MIAYISTYWVRGVQKGQNIDYVMYGPQCQENFLYQFQNLFGQKVNFSVEFLLTYPTPGPTIQSTKTVMDLDAPEWCKCTTRLSILIKVHHSILFWLNFDNFGMSFINVCTTRFKSLNPSLKEKVPRGIEKYFRPPLIFVSKYYF